MHMNFYGKKEEENYEYLYFFIKKIFFLLFNIIYIYILIDDMSYIYIYAFYYFCIFIYLYLVDDDYYILRVACVYYLLKKQNFFFLFIYILKKNLLSFYFFLLLLREQVDDSKYFCFSLISQINQNKKCVCERERELFFVVSFLFRLANTFEISTIHPHFLTPLPDQYIFHCDK